MGRRGFLWAVAAAPSIVFADDAANAPAIESVELMRSGDRRFVEVRDTEGTVGRTPANNRLPLTPRMFRRLVADYFVGKPLGGRADLGRLVDGVYYSGDERGSVYKFAGMPFWNAVAHVEVACWDLLGRRAGRPVGELLGGRRRDAVDVYISEFGRETTAEQEVENAERDLEKTGATAVKLKVGLRMRTTPEQTRRDRRMIELARGRWGGAVTVYVDANGSYDAAGAVEMGRFLDDHGVALFEEPLPWQDRRGTREVTGALAGRAIRVAGGEQDSSLYDWAEMAERRVVDVLQPDVFYNGGLVRTLRVAALAKRHGRPLTPHSPKVLPEAAATLQLLSCVEGLGPFQEYRSYGTVKDGRVAIPAGPGLGVDDGWYRRDAAKAVRTD